MLAPPTKSARDHGQVLRSSQVYKPFEFIGCRSAGPKIAHAGLVASFFECNLEFGKRHLLRDHWIGQRLRVAYLVGDVHTLRHPIPVSWRPWAGYLRQRK